MNLSARRYNDLNAYFRKTFGCRVQKIAVDAGLTCPNRDGTIATGGCIYCNARGSGTGAMFSQLHSLWQRSGFSTLPWCRR